MATRFFGAPGFYLDVLVSVPVPLGAVVSAIQMKDLSCHYTLKSGRLLLGGEGAFLKGKCCP